MKLWFKPKETIEVAPPKKVRGKPFVKGDPRINREGVRVQQQDTNYYFCRACPCGSYVCGGRGNPKDNDREPTPWTNKNKPPRITTHHFSITIGSSTSMLQDPDRVYEWSHGPCCPLSGEAIPEESRCKCRQPPLTPLDAPHDRPPRGAEAVADLFPATTANSNTGNSDVISEATVKGAPRVEPV